MIGGWPRSVEQTLPERQPVIGGVVAQRITDLLQQGSWSAEDAEACAIRTSVDPSEDPEADQFETDALKSSCALFAHTVLQGPLEMPYEGRFILGRHHVEWDQLIHNFTRLCILASRDHGKSQFFTVAYSIWKAGFNEPGSYGVIFSATQTQAEEFLGKIKTELLTNPKLAHLIPYTGERFWSSKKIK